ncbi:hypothetical protein DYB25_003100 [Aphanomyces astaci]|uniref:Endopeptidase S2P n=1 Tax=Aphanomyces astaci TaxID=112090 RepID=A0A397DTS7_APHAT|nr:hypothetical protein DYB25_003100 [Aphanomyces astaci]RHY68091.1 hypothetical protein DYB30_005478 [Aphanomyces astaci]
MALICMLQLMLLPSLLSPWYATHQGLTVTSMPEFSIFDGLVDIGNVVVSLDHAPTLTLAAWKSEIATLTGVVDQPYATWKPVGYCIPSLDLASSTADTSCCHVDNDNTDSALQCFAHGGQSNNELDPSKKLVCLDGNQVGGVSTARCSSDDSCGSGSEDSNQLPPPYTCVLPKLQDAATLIRIGLRGNVTLMVHGYPPDLHAELHLSPYTTTHKSPSSTSLSTTVWLSLPTWIERFWQFVGNVSGTLGLFNALPIHHLDGSHLCASYLQLVVADEATRGQVLKIILTIGDALLVAVGVLSMWP